MTIFEQYLWEVKYNSEHVLFAPTDDYVLGERHNGYFSKIITDNEHLCQEIIFDNGERFLHDLEESMLYHLERIDEEYFIHKFLEKIVYDFIHRHGIRNEETGFLSVGCFEYEVNENEMCEIKAGSLIRLVVHRAVRVVYLPNFHLPDRLRKQGLGLKMMGDIYEVCKLLNYRFVLVDMVEYFYNRMVARGAKVLISYDRVEITDDTYLGDRSKIG